MAEQVAITCTARLHLGFLDMNGLLGRRFGSIGLALDAPATRLTLRRATRLSVSGPERARAEKYLRTMAERLALPAGHHLDIAEAIPTHAGLGSGTQLALGIAAALRRLHGLPLDPRADAAALGRGRRSGIGIALFARGGLVVDGGVGERGLPPPLLARVAVPEDWRILLVLDATGQGLFGNREIAAFSELPSMSEPMSGRLCRLALMGALPAAAEDDLAAFGAAVSEIQAIVGDYFAPVQGGRFGSPRVAATLSAMRTLGACGTGQSSWGPSGFGFVRGERAAEDIREAMARRDVAPGLEIRLCRPCNRGAAIVET